jgi:chorismate synthase
MSGNSFGTLFRITTFGESHGRGIGVIIDGMIPGIDIAAEDIQKELDRRKPGQSEVTTKRKEADRVEILSGTFEGRSTGTPLAMILYNTSQRPEDYEQYRNIFRPGHADFTYYKKYGIRDFRGGARASGRETAARVAAGAVAKLLLQRRGVEVRAYTIRAAGIECSVRDLSVVESNPLRACDAEAAKAMEEKIKKLAEEGESAGGVIECRVTGADPGLGEPVFSKLDGELARAVLSLGSIKGIEFGKGFAAADMKGSEHNDWMTGGGFSSNNAGGILGGISTGEEIIFRAAVKPTSSVEALQETQTLTGEATTVSIRGRHDPCICPRVVPVIEAMTALVLEDMYRIQESRRL